MLRVSIILAMLMSFTANAQDTPEKDNLDKLFEVMQMDVMTNAMFSNMQAMLSDFRQQSDISSEELAIYEKYEAQTIALMKKEYSWNVMKEDVRQIYLQNFTDEEIAGILAFYQSSAGQALLRTMPVVMQESMQMSQRLAQSAMPKLQAIAEQRTQELSQLQQSKE